MAVLRLSRPLRFSRSWLLSGAGALVLAVGGALVGPAILAQIEGDRGIAPIASTGDFEVSGIEVNVQGSSAADARAKGWQEAEKLAWQKLWKTNSLGGGEAPALDAGTLDAMVAAVVVEQEQIGPHRYIARLGVTFDRARTGGYLGMHGQVARSAPLLIIPVLYEGGVASVYETRTPWQRAWAEFHTGESAIDYVRPNGGGADSLLLTEGQLTRRSRNWWRLVLDEFGAADVVMPIARLTREFPGGPIHGTFTARHGPDNRFIGQFDLTAPSDDQLPQMLADAVHRLDALYTQALQQGQLAPDPSLNMAPQLDTKLINQILDSLGPVQQSAPSTTPAPGVPVTGAAPAGPAAATFTVQVATADGAALDAGLAAVRGVAGVQGAATSSVAIGGTSVLRVTYAGNLETLAAALRAQGWKVTAGANALSIRR
ncbi:heavy-metal-associated domain-containing protein [Novosphingobium pokkalii]|uniref:Heavy-metal-associated domain-containing protein n=1 Tax=Novosphingobium pokkalii TaxID=1770194 RepID=A0ABV7UYU2_9SPHN|nr:heavy-metal-associated domain-containing protein [Novosphingobium pokkalii]GHC99258.1 hypothetical protein GCM10019060_31740 [Novosphingobium pokkalii]